MSKKAWKFWVDRGGTFTDLIGCDSSGHLHIRKVLSEGGEDDPAVQVMRELLAISAEEMAADGTLDASPSDDRSPSETETSSLPRWAAAILGSVPRDAVRLGFSEYASYASWVAANHPETVELAPARLWSRHPFGPTLGSAGIRVARSPAPPRRAATIERVRDHSRFVKGVGWAAGAEARVEQLRHIRTSEVML